eukprot:GFUD01136651.1.p1 GENE.GFUD01136651.1~~GFUD01136651.1.p1  ORF type:complete len:613 (+),score=118.61 GFUD01136651.1:100-1938(+)
MNAVGASTGWQPPGPGGAHGNQNSFTPGQAVEPTSTVELSIRCRDLADMDVFSKSDPFCVLYVKDSKSGQWLCLDKTETIDNTLEPHFEKKFVLQYKFEERQLLRFDVYDSDGNSNNLEDHDFIGSMECSLGEVVAHQGKGLTRHLLVGSGKSARNKEQSITITSEELISNKEFLSLNISAKSLDAKDWWGWGSSDPFLTISKAGEYGQWTVVHRTEVLKRNLNPDWQPFTLSITSLCNADHQRTLKFSVDDWNLNGTHSHIGEFTTNVAELVEGGLKTSRGSAQIFPLISQKKKSKKGDKYRNSGFLHVNYCILELQPTFLDYISNGTELSFTVAIDFTASNGNPQDPRSLHYNDPTGAPNQYITAIKAVGEIIQDYDSDKMFPALGFGARIPPDGKVSHEFFLNLTGDPYCSGVDGILAAYHQSLHNVQLYGPTNFAPVINHVAKFARAYQQDPSNYFVLLIITDGVITDLDATKNAVIHASGLPLSIIIVGVGSEDFSAMDELDSDDSLLTNNGRTAQRDIVQFVEMQKFISGSGSHYVTWNKDLLAREVLFEIPEQLVGYMKAKKFKPIGKRPARPTQTNSQLPYNPSAQSPPPGYAPSVPGAPPPYS